MVHYFYVHLVYICVVFVLISFKMIDVVPNMFAFRKTPVSFAGLTKLPSDSTQNDVPERLSFEKRWNDIVDTEEVNRFRSEYVRRCPSFKTTYTLNIESGKDRNISADLLATRGLASALNSVLSAFVLCDLVDPPRKFYLAAEKWNYGNFNTVFMDFTDRTVCHITKLKPVLADRSTRLRLLPNGTVKIDGPHALFELSILPHQIPAPYIKKIIRLMWSELTDFDGKYVFFHIRRGDKHKEAQEVPVRKFLEKYMENCGQGSSCSRTVFVMCDGEKTCNDFKSQLGPGYRYAHYSSLMSSWKLWVAAQHYPEHSQEKFDALSETERLAQTTELIVSLYLAALADSVFCTYSSNVCRLIALLRGGTLDNSTVYSLDTTNWHNYR
ncbi:hypothetical protein RvY_02866-2 [Ramazzottius varieornatus]|uniref:GT23 domain-containing protein n=1 Tax=Ramazzottius varieornatus TaxID=947166 RepID=A0A1D1URW5_RAMVA|nr:hypothetical protein RvY_02866-2 [Ramazzottius varieornatus]